MDETANNLPDQTKLVLDVADGDGTFKSRDLVLQMKEVWNQDEQIEEFFNLDSIWYCKKEVGNTDTIAIVDEMNNFYRDANPYGGNPFDKQLWELDDSGNPQPISENKTFNQWLEKLNCIIENRFYKNVLRDDGVKGEDNPFG